MTADSACLGLEILGKCNYDPSAPSQSYFTIGQLVAVIALLLAFSQLTTPIIKFRIRAHKINYKAAIVLCAFAIGFIFLAAILPFIPGQARPLLGYPVFWEILAGVIFVVVGVDLIIAISREPSFKRSNAEAYFKACAAVIAKGNDDDLRELADEVFHSVKPIFDECNTYNQEAARVAKEQGRKYHIENSTRIAFTILDLWSNKSFCRHIICNAPATALQIFDQLIHNDPYRSKGYALSQQLIHQAFVNRDSILMREEDYSGLGFFKQFRKTVFNEWQFIEGRHRPLDAWKSYEEKEVHPWQVKKYNECLEASFEAYFAAQEYWQYPASMWLGLEKLAHLAMNQISVVQHSDERDLYPSNAYSILLEVENGLRRIVTIVEKYQEKLPKYDIKEDQYDRLKDVSIYGVVAHGIYEYFEQLATTQRHDDMIRQCAIGLWLDIFGVESSAQSSPPSEIGKRLIIHLNKKVDENLDPEQRWYPVITRLLISLHGLYESKGSEKESTRIDMIFHRAFMERLRHDYPKLVKRDPEFAARLLPENFSYDSVKNEIRHKRWRGEVAVFKLATEGGLASGAPASV